MAEQTLLELDLTAPDNYADLQTYLHRNFSIIQQALQNGLDVTGTFTTVDNKTITITNGIVTGIV